MSSATGLIVVIRKISRSADTKMRPSADETSAAAS
jgi:hypothetical protein